MSKTVHFTVDKSVGILLANIAQEHFVYDDNLEKALDVFASGGAPEEIQLKLLTGEMIILMDDSGEGSIVNRKGYMHLDKMYPKLDLVEHFNRKRKEMDDNLERLEDSLDEIADKFKFSSSYRFDFSVDSVIGFLYGNDEQMLKEVREDYELNRMRFTIDIVRKFIEKSFRLAELARKINGLYKLNIEFDTFHLLVLSEKVRKLKELNLSSFNIEEDNSLSNYLNAVQEIDKVMSNGIEPVDIMDNWSAGWLSPEGEYYALNGEIANMLHNQIADALQEKGIIPMYNNDREKEINHKANPDAWLEQHGWVRIHGNAVHFAGNLNKDHYSPQPIVHITEKQIDVILKYINNCHQCMMRAGWRLQKESVTRFAVLAKQDKFALYKKYFDY